MLLLYTVMLLVGSAFGQAQQGYVPPTTTQPGYIPPTTTQQGYLPPRTTYLPPANTVTRTNTITATDCRTEDRFVTNTVDVASSQAVTLVLCTKNLATETVQRQIVTPVDDSLVVRTTTQQLQPRTIVVTDVSTNLDLRTQTGTVTATLTHRSRNVISTTLTNTRTQTLTRTTLVVSTRINTRFVTQSTTQTVTNTIIIDVQPVVGGSFSGGILQSGIIDGQVIGFGGEARRSRGFGLSGSVSAGSAGSGLGGSVGTGSGFGGSVGSGFGGSAGSGFGGSAGSGFGGSAGSGFGGSAGAAGSAGATGSGFGGSAGTGSGSAGTGSGFGGSAGTGSGFGGSAGTGSGFGGSAGAGTGFGGSAGAGSGFGGSAGSRPGIRQDYTPPEASAGGTRSFGSSDAQAPGGAHAVIDGAVGGFGGEASSSRGFGSSDFGSSGLSQGGGFQDQATGGSRPGIHQDYTPPQASAGGSRSSGSSDTQAHTTGTRAGRPQSDTTPSAPRRSYLPQ